MRYQQDLQVQLRHRYRRLVTAQFGNATHETCLIVDWITRQPSLRALLAEAEQVEPALDFAVFEKAIKSNQGGVPWTSTTEAGRAILGWRMMQEIVHAPQDDREKVARSYIIYISNDSNFTTGWQEYVEQALQPFFDYLSENLSTGDSVHYVLERYIRNVEWFDRDSLYVKYQTDTANGEEVYNLDLQRHLFNDGNYITQAKARSASGEPDLIGGLETDNPLICDGKLFTIGRSKSYIAKGFHQVIQYAHDHNKNTAYLVVFNLTDRLLQFPTDGDPAAWPHYVESSGVRVHFIGIRALPPQNTASKAGKATPAIITRDELFNPDAGKIHAGSDDYEVVPSHEN